MINHQLYPTLPHRTSADGGGLVVKQPPVQPGHRHGKYPQPALITITESESYGEQVLSSDRSPHTLKWRKRDPFCPLPPLLSRGSLLRADAKWICWIFFPPPPPSLFFTTPPSEHVEVMVIWMSINDVTVLRTIMLPIKRWWLEGFVRYTRARSGESLFFYAAFSGLWPGCNRDITRWFELDGADESYLTFLFVLFSVFCFQFLIAAHFFQFQTSLIGSRLSQVNI